MIQEWNRSSKISQYSFNESRKITFNYFSRMVVLATKDISHQIQGVHDKSLKNKFWKIHSSLIIFLSYFHTRRVYGRAVKGLSLELEGLSSSPETADFLTNSYGQATNASVSLFTKQCKLVPAGYRAGWGETLCAFWCLTVSLRRASRVRNGCMQSWNMFFLLKQVFFVLLSFQLYVWIQ